MCLNFLCSVSIFQRVNSVMVLNTRRGYGSNHDCLRITAQTIFKYPCQFAEIEGHKLHYWVTNQDNNYRSYLLRYGTYARPFFCCFPKAFMQFAKARSERLILAPSLSFWPPLFVSEARSLHHKYIHYPPFEQS